MSLKMHTFAVVLALVSCAAMAEDFSILGGVSQSEQPKKRSPGRQATPASSALVASWAPSISSARCTQKK